MNRSNDEQSRRPVEVTNPEIIDMFNNQIKLR